MITYELSYFICDLQIAMRDEGTFIDNKLPPPPDFVTQAVNGSLKACKVSFLRTQKYNFVRLEFLRTAIQ